MSLITSERGLLSRGVLCVNLIVIASPVIRSEISEKIEQEQEILASLLTDVSFKELWDTMLYYMPG